MAAVSMSVDADGIARLVPCPTAGTAPESQSLQARLAVFGPPVPSTFKPPVGGGPPAMGPQTLTAAAPASREMKARLPKAAPQAPCKETRNASTQATGRSTPASTQAPLPAAPRQHIVKHSSGDGVSLTERVREALQTVSDEPEGGAATEVVIEVYGQCTDSEPLEISAGAVTLYGVPESYGAGKPRLLLPGVRITGGALCLSNLELIASEENRVENGLLRCTNCLITSQRGCGVLCLSRAILFLRDCEVTRCSRSGIGVNGKGAEIDVQACIVAHNNFSGIGVNQRARSLVLQGNSIKDNGYRGVWLNVGVVAQWLSGDMSGNKRSDQGGPGLLHGFEPTRPCGGPQLPAQ